MNQKIILDPDAPVSDTHNALKRLLNLAIVVLIILISASLWTFGDRHQQEFHQHLANQVGQSVTDFTTGAAEHSIATPEQLQQLLAPAQEHTAILAVSVYDSNGQRIAHQGNDSALLELYQSNTPPLVYVGDVTKDGRPLAYVRLLLDPEPLAQRVNEYHHRQQQNTELLLVLAFLLGLLVMQLVSKGHRAWQEQQAKRKAR